MISSTLFALALAGTSPSVDCDALYQRHLETDLALSYQEFDQTMGSGFRAVANAGCRTQAADLIAAYIAANDSIERSLTWHIAQLRGEAGQVEAAKAAARSVLSADAATDAPFLWNDHVRAYLAILEGDREAYDRHRAALHAGSEKHPGNAMNAKLWDRLAANFELGYAGAIELY